MRVRWMRMMVCGAALVWAAATTWGAGGAPCEIGPGRVGPLRSGMSVAAAKRALPGTLWVETDDQGSFGIYRVLRDGKPVFEIFPDQNEMTEVVVIRVLTAECGTASGIRPGAPAAGAAGADRGESGTREFARWPQAPAWLAIEVAGPGGGPAGEYAGAARCAGRVRAGSVVRAVWVSKPGGAPPRFSGDGPACAAGK